MEVKQYTFKNIFDEDFKTKSDVIRLQKIIIPIIQRDYAQGRVSKETNRIRERFLNALYSAIANDKPIKLDFIYGDIDENGTLIPLDGQQRLTTLFLLYWYAAKKENVSPEECAFLENFSYETRPDSRDFCKRLVIFQPSFAEKFLSAEIGDQEWFSLSWKKDPTVSSMLTMIDAIDEKFSEIENLWEKISGNTISFYFLPIKDMGLTNELYITMNSRGKPLTDFEHFKAEFKHKLDEIDAEVSNKIILKIDTKWTNLLWKYRDEKNLVDSGFLHYFRFVCDILLYEAGGTPQGKDRDSFKLLDEHFSAGSKNIKSNLDFLEKSFDCWCEVENIDEFFEKRASIGNRINREINKHERGKIIIYYDSVNLFKACLKSYGESKDGRTRKFSLGEFILLYGFLHYLLNREKISDEDFRRRIRVVNNLVNNSLGAELSDSETRQGGNRMPAMLKQVKSIMTDGKILKGIGPNFNEEQLKEEIEKFSWTEKNPDKAELLFELEDHYLLYGQISIIDLQDVPFFKRFISLFKCDYDLIDCALMASGDYYQTDRNKQRFQFGSSKYVKAWQNLFHKSSYSERFEETQIALSKLLERAENFTDDYLKKIISDYIADCQKKSSFEWQYYYIKYPAFRPGRYGKYYWEKFETEPYLMTSLWAERRSSRAYQPFLKAAVSEDIFKYYNAESQCLLFNEYYIECVNDGYAIKNRKSGKEEGKISVKQIDNIDTEDRIKKFRQSKILELMMP